MIRRLTLVMPLLAAALNFASMAAAQNGPYYATPSWDQTLPCSTTADCPRFVLVMGGVAVLDRETGLVWEQTPTGGLHFYFEAFQSCSALTKGGRQGWRLPALHELQSLIDPTIPFPPPGLPPGNPFAVASGVNFFWTGTSVSNDPNQAWSVLLSVAFPPTSIVKAGVSEGDASVWCVRGGGPATAQ